MILVVFDISLLFSTTTIVFVSRMLISYIEVTITVAVPIDSASTLPYISTLIIPSGSTLQCTYL